MKEYDEISLQDLFQVFVRNLNFVIVLTVIGLLLGGILGAVQHMRSPVEYRYRAQVTLALEDQVGRANQPTVILNLVTSKTIFDAATSHLRISNEEYVVRTGESTKPGEFDVYVEGPDGAKAIALANEVVARARSIAQPALSMASNYIVEAGRVEEDPSVVSEPPDYTMVTAFGGILGGMLAVIIVFLTVAIRGAVQRDKDVERLLQVPVLATIQENRKKGIFEKIFGLR